VALKACQRPQLGGDTDRFRLIPRASSGAAAGPRCGAPDGAALGSARR
jgi:hypothetical protein